jgi:hypothetical protein
MMGSEKKNKKPMPEKPGSPGGKINGESAWEKEFSLSKGSCCDEGDLAASPVDCSLK